MYGCKSWTIKKAECQRIDAFELWCWRSLYRVPWTARRSKQSILKEIIPEYSLEGLMLKLKLQYFGHLMQRTDSFERPWFWVRLKAGGEADHRGWEGWMTSLTLWICIWASSRSWCWTGKPGVLPSMGSHRVGHNWTTELIWVKWREDYLGVFPGGSYGKESACSGGDLVSIPGSGRSPGESNGYPLQYSCLENCINRGAW